jgi:putative ABC transport system substrate-binding protein
MRRREFMTLVGGTAFRLPLAARAEQVGSARRVGVLMGYEPNPPGHAMLKSFEQSLKKLGWTLGSNVNVEVRWTGVDAERIQRFARKLAAWQPDVIVTSSTPTTVAAQREARTIPIVFAFVSDPIGLGVVESLARPGGNVTGFINFEGSLSGKLLALLKEIYPRAVRAAGLFNPDAAPGGGSFFSSPFEAAAQNLGITPLVTPVRSEADIDTAISTIGDEPSGGLVMMPDSFMWIHRARFIEQAARNRVIAIYPYAEAAADGGLLSYGPDVSELFVIQVALYVDRILRGARPSELPVQLPTKFELVINLRTARTLGLDVPPTLLARADQVID